MSYESTDLKTDEPIGPFCRQLDENDQALDEVFRRIHVLKSKLTPFRVDQMAQPIDIDKSLEPAQAVQGSPAGRQVFHQNRKLNELQKFISDLTDELVV